MITSEYEFQDQGSMTVLPKLAAAIRTIAGDN